MELNTKKRLQSILINIEEGVMVFDNKGKVLLTNKAASNIFLINWDKLVGKNLWEFSTNLPINNLLNEVLVNGRESFIETTIQPDFRVFRVHMTPLRNELNEITEVTAIFRDVTSKRKFEQMRSDFVANVSHELRTPLTSIKGFVETLLDGEVQDKVLLRKFLNIIDAETNRLNRLIDELLTLSAIESQQRIVKQMPVCIGRSIRNVLNILGPQISEKNLHIEYIYPNNLPLIHADEDLLGQVLINLIDNAIKYTYNGGKVIIRSFPKNSRIITKVTDSGMGIPSESIPRIFERFYRVNKARSRSNGDGGTGLGLAIVKHIVEAHGGEVFVESEIGKGSTFGFSIVAV
ncbi:Phosphate regulon sensor protein PhoR (SphS) [Candidatus Syntrophocurvum alkaliphilum]|uniref:histidine kinase n=1 Tax=Candidatus Syntrophocurvum alkaliphilum TaxID=2293317 RepID=A0A6I6DER9_9FIRM|nr:ATP-binding protein [Candidatus Syntrophocurvum alkaliphilum]QGT99696.1 Phosphate regulon sensor protein PhoR (SphS) [Candidatus Syntrophocurvum alkaliphilum]